jgi:hypothetical protein
VTTTAAGSPPATGAGSTTREYLFVEGRADDTIIRGGENVAPAEVEDVLLGHPAVVDVAVVGPPDDEWGQRIVAAVVTEPDRLVSEDELRAWAKERLRSSKTPDRNRLPPGAPPHRHRQAPAPGRAGRGLGHERIKGERVSDALIVSACRTAIGTAFKGTLAQTSAFDLAHAVVDASVARSGVDAEAFDDVVLGESMYGGGDIARHAAITAGLTSVAGLAHNRHCASGLAAVQTAAASDAGGDGRGRHRRRCAVQLDLAQDPLPAARRRGVDRPLGLALAPDRPDAPNLDMSITAGWNAAQRVGVTREDMDAWALRSHRNAIQAIDEGRFTDEIIPLDVVGPDASRSRSPSTSTPGGALSMSSLRPFASSIPRSRGSPSRRATPAAPTTAPPPWPWSPRPVPRTSPDPLSLRCARGPRWASTRRRPGWRPPRPSPRRWPGGAEPRRRRPVRDQRGLRRHVRGHHPRCSTSTPTRST